MKASFWDRVLMFLYVLLSCALLLGVALRPFGADIIGDLVGGLEAVAGRFWSLVIGYGIVLIVALLGVYMLLMIFRRVPRADRTFITVESGDGGRVRVAFSALEQMVRQAIEGVEGVRDMRIEISGDASAISVEVELSLLAGAHVPTVTMDMQRTIRKNIEHNCGVTVRQVEIAVTSLLGEEGLPKRRILRKRRKVPIPVPTAEEIPFVAEEPAAEEEVLPEAAQEISALSEEWPEADIFESPAEEEGAPEEDEPEAQP